jgi:hypothetical protein
MLHQIHFHMPPKQIPHKSQHKLTKLATSEVEKREAWLIHDIHKQQMIHDIHKKKMIHDIHRQLQHLASIHKEDAS